MKCFI